MWDYTPNVYILNKIKITEGRVLETLPSVLYQTRNLRLQTPEINSI